MTWPEAVVYSVLIIAMCATVVALVILTERPKTQAPQATKIEVPLWTSSAPVPPSEKEPARAPFGFAP